MIKIMLVDDQVILRESLKYIIEQDKDITVIASAQNGLDAVEKCSDELPDVVLMDIMMPICNGVEGTKIIKQKYDNVKVIILTTFGDDENLKKALENGADAYVLKDITPEELILTIKSVKMGLGVVHKSAYQTIVKSMGQSDEKKDASQKINMDEYHITDRELDIIRLIVDGRNNKEIAAELFLTEGTVKNIVSNILYKLQLKDRTQLAVFAVKNNIV